MTPKQKAAHYIAATKKALEEAEAEFARGELKKAHESMRFVFVSSSAAYRALEEIGVKK